MSPGKTGNSSGAPGQWRPGAFAAAAMCNVYHDSLRDLSSQSAIPLAGACIILLNKDNNNKGHSLKKKMSFFYENKKIKGEEN